jgi:hypothetical protein
VKEYPLFREANLCNGRTKDDRSIFYDEESGDGETIKEKRKERGRMKKKKVKLFFTRMCFKLRFAFAVGIFLAGQISDPIPHPITKRALTKLAPSKQLISKVKHRRLCPWQRSKQPMPHSIFCLFKYPHTSA